MPTENRSSNTELSKIVTDALVAMVSGITGMKPPAGEPLPGFIQAPIDRAAERIAALLAQENGFSAGDMADQGAKAFRDGKQAAVPEGFALVPKEMLLSKEVIGAINFHCGDSDKKEGGQFGTYTDGRLWIGSVRDDEGNEVHGLHLMTEEYPEEGSTTLVEFPPSSCTIPK